MITSPHDHAHFCAHVGLRNDPEDRYTGSHFSERLKGFKGQRLYQLVSVLRDNKRACIQAVDQLTREPIDHAFYVPFDWFDTSRPGPARRDGDLILWT